MKGKHSRLLASLLVSAAVQCVAMEEAFSQSSGDCIGQTIRPGYLCNIQQQAKCLVSSCQPSSIDCDGDGTNDFKVPTNIKLWSTCGWTGEYSPADQCAQCTSFYCSNNTLYADQDMNNPPNCINQCAGGSVNFCSNCCQGY